MASYVIKQLFGGQISTSGDNTLFTVPAGHRYLIKQMSLYVDPTGANETRIVKISGRIIATGDSGSGNELVHNYANPTENGGEISQTGEVGTVFDVVLSPGDTFVVNLPNTNPCDVIVSGIDYTI